MSGKTETPRWAWATYTDYPSLPRPSLLSITSASAISGGAAQPLDIQHISIKGRSERGREGEKVRGFCIGKGNAAILWAERGEYMALPCPALMLFYGWLAAVALNAIFFILCSGNNSGRSPFPRLLRPQRRQPRLPAGPA